MDGKKVFWVIAVLVALASIAAGVAYFVTRYLSKKEYAYDGYLDCNDYDDYDDDFGCECAECAKPQPEEEAAQPTEE